MLIELENTRAYRPIFDYLTDALEGIEQRFTSLEGKFEQVLHQLAILTAKLE